MAYEYRTRKHETAERYFRCARCGARGEVAFRAEGDSGWHQDAALLFVDGAKERSTTAADEALMTDAERTLGLVRCPTCGERDRATVRWARARVAAWLAAALAFGLYFGFAIWIGILVFAVGGGVQLWRELARVRRADHAQIVKFTPGTLPAPPKPKELPPPPPPPARVAPPIPVARALAAPPLTPKPQAEPPQARRGDDGPAFLHDRDKP